MIMESGTLGKQFLKSGWMLLLAILFCTSLFYRLGSWGAIDTSEGRYAEIGRKMHVSGDYLHPTYLGIEHYHKPPMTYWISAISYKIFGVNAFAARFFLQIAFLVQLILLYKLAKLWWPDDDRALISTMIFASFLIVVVSARNLTTDAYLSTFLLASTWSIISYCETAKPKFIYLFSLFMSLAFLTKITAVFVFMGPVILFALYHYRGKIHFNWHFLTAFIVWLSLSISWFVLLQIEGKDVFRYMMYDQSVVRYASDTFKRSMPAYFYLAATSLLSFPWFFLGLSGSVKSIRTKNPTWITWLFGLCFLLPILFFSLSHSKLLLYILPGFWALALSAGHFLINSHDRIVRNWLIAATTFSLLVIIALVVVPFVDSKFQLSTGLYVWCAISSALILFTALQKQIDVHHRLLVIPVILAISMQFMSSHFLSTNEDNSASGKLASEWIISKELNNRPVYIHDKMAPSFPFHLNRDVALIGVREEREIQFETSDTWKEFYYDQNDDVRLHELNQRLNVPSVLLARKHRIDKIHSSILEHFKKRETVGLWTIFY